VVLALPLHRDSFPEGYGWYHGGVFGRCGCRILLRFPIAEALKRLTGPRTYLPPPADSGRDRLFGRSLALPEALRETEGDIVNCESAPGRVGSLSVSSYSPYSMRTIHYVPLGPNAVRRHASTVFRN
jgi:hypothetical protein